MNGVTGTLTALWEGYSGVARTAIDGSVGNILAAIGGMMVAILSLYVIVVGKQMMFGEINMGTATTRAVRALMVSALMAPALFGQFVTTALTKTFPDAVAAAVGGNQAATGAAAFDQQLVHITTMSAGIRAQMIGLLYIGDRVALWITELVAKLFVLMTFLEWAIAGITIYLIPVLLALLAWMYLFDSLRAFVERTIGMAVGLLLVQATVLIIAGIVVQETNQFLDKFATTIQSAGGNPGMQLGGDISFTAFSADTPGLGLQQDGGGGGTVNTDASLELLANIALVMAFGWLFLTSATVIAFTIAATSGFSGGSIVRAVSRGVQRAATAIMRRRVA